MKTVWVLLWSNDTWLWSFGGVFSSIQHATEKMMRDTSLDIVAWTTHKSGFGDGDFWFDTEETSEYITTYYRLGEFKIL
jgi:hypothetical protein